MNNNHDSVRTETQFSVVLANKPGVLAGVVQHLADRKVNIAALSMMDSTEHGVLRLVAENPDSARMALGELNLPKSEQQVVVATLPNHAGAFAGVVAQLASQHINIHYAYCTTGARGGKTLGILKVDNVPKAIQVLGERKPRRREDVSAVRRNVVKRRR